MLEVDEVSPLSPPSSPTSPPRRGRFARLRPTTPILPSSPLLRLYLFLLSLCVLLDLHPTFSTRNTPRPLLPTTSQCVARGLLQSHPSPAIARLREDHDCGCKRPAVYEAHENPRVAAIVQSHNHVGNIPAIATALVDNPAIDEIIVCEDGSTDGSLDAWTDLLTGLAHFVVISNDLHEVRCYNRAMRMSSAEYFVLLQDDDIPGAKTVLHTEAAARERAAAAERGDAEPPVEDLPVRNWVTDGLDLMEADEKLGVLSGFIGQMWGPGDNGFEFGEQQSDHGGTRKGPTRRVPFVSPVTSRPFMYVECAWIAPVIVRAKALRRIGGFDVDVFNVGEPGVWQDCLLSYTAWAAGWRVGVYDAMFERGVGGHGSTSTKEKTAMRGKMWKKAKAVVDDRFERGFIRDHVLLLNNQTLNRRYSV